MKAAKNSPGQIDDEEPSFNLDEMMQEKEKKKRLEAKNSQTYLTGMMPNAQKGSAESIGRKPSPN